MCSFLVTYPYDILSQVCYLIISIPGLCLRAYFECLGKDEIFSETLLGENKFVAGTEIQLIQKYTSSDLILFTEISRHIRPGTQCYYDILFLLVEL